MTESRRPADDACGENASVHELLPRLGLDSRDEVHELLSRLERQIADSS